MRSVNQNHHLYVVKGVVDGSTVTSFQDGYIKPVVSGDAETNLYFMYKGRDGMTRSDFIPKEQITYIKHVAAADMQTYMKKATVTLKAEAMKNNLPIPGTDYVLNISFQNFYGLSPEDTYVKTVAVRATSSMTMANFYAAFEDELNASFSREVGADATSNPYLTFSSSSSGLVITEKEQDWKLGKWEVERLTFEVFPSTVSVDVDTNEVVWGNVVYADDTNNPIPNSKRMADLEWFTFAERADFYRGMGYPNNFDFIPWIAPGNTDGYDVLEIHFAYQGTCEDIQKSEKDITLVGSDDDIAAIAATIATNLGITVSTSPSVDGN